MQSTYVQFGCGVCAPPSWRNFDNSLTLRLQKTPILGRLLSKRLPNWPANVEVGDVILGLPFKANSVDVIYSSHVIEHLALNEMRVALKNIYQYLIPGGTFRFVLPDLEYAIREYVDSTRTDASIIFFYRTMLGTQVRPRTWFGRVRQVFGNSAHLWMWDYKGIKGELEKAGFKDIRRCQFHDSSDLRFEEVEDPNRWGFNSLGVECKK